MTTGHFYVPQNVHPLVKQLFEELNRQRVPLRRVSNEAGVSDATIKNWRKRQRATLENIDAVFNSLGYRLVAEKINPEGRAAA